MLVTERFELHPLVRRSLREREIVFGYGLLGAAAFYRTYSRTLDDGSQEQWPDVVIRCIEGAFSILKWWRVSHLLPWDEAAWHSYAVRMARAMFAMRWLPPGRGLQTGGTLFSYEEGALCHQNCGATDVTHLSSDARWMMNALMHGVGVGFGTSSYGADLGQPLDEIEVFQIPDSREGWTESVRRLIASYEEGSKTVEFDYSLVRPAGAPIKRFGGTASGSGPLRQLHETLRPVLSQYARAEISEVRVVADVMNLIGTCVVAGGVRRTAEIAIGAAGNTEFLDLKNYGTADNPGPAYDRLPWGWTSNNSVAMWDHSDFRHLPEIAERIRLNGEPGVLNFINIQRYGRMAEELPDEATLINPCGEQPLENKEVCCLADVFANRCSTRNEFLEAVEFATTYATIITLLPTHEPVTNQVIAKNRRIGVSISAVAEWLVREHTSSVISTLRQGYKVARETNRRLANSCGVPESVRVTTVKPNGTTSLLTGASPGLHFPPYGRYVRRMRVQEQAPIVPYLIEAGVPHEPDKYSSNTIVFEFPVDLGKVRGQREVSMWHKGALAVMMQRHWSDNATSVTVTFDPATEGHEIENFLAMNMPSLKSLSMLPETDNNYEQKPYEETTLRDVEERKAAIKPVDWRTFRGAGIERELYCDGEKCVI